MDAFSRPMRVRSGTLDETFGKDSFPPELLHLGVAGGYLGLSLERTHLEKTGGKKRQKVAETASHREREE